jgi:hypothetical protein
LLFPAPCGCARFLSFCKPSAASTMGGLIASRQMPRHAPHTGPAAVSATPKAPNVPDIGRSPLMAS